MSQTVVHGSNNGRAERACDRHYRRPEPGVEVSMDPRAITCKNKACADVRRTYETELHTAARSAGTVVPWTYTEDGHGVLVLPDGSVYSFTDEASMRELEDVLDAAGAAVSAARRTLAARKRFAGNALALERIEEIRDQEFAK